MDASECRYCQDTVDWAEKVADLSASTLYLTKDQSNKGRCILAVKGHHGEPFQLPDQEWAAFSADLRRAAKALNSAFKPDKINYGAYGDTYPHFHFHIVPKYRGGKSWGGPFDMNLAPQRTVPDAEFESIIAEIKKYL
ncbi:HIT family protein [Spirochaetia bacterium]|nr:HIT family protein [Spirochaetia bacterium]